VAQVTVEAQYIADTTQYVRALRAAAAATTQLANQIPPQLRMQNELADGLDETRESAEDAGKGFTILRNAMGTALGVAAVNTVTQMVGRMKNFARQSFDAAARVEELEIAMQSIGSATGVGAKAIEDATQAIRDNGIELGAAQQIAIEFAQNQLDLAKASKIARVAQDLAVIAGRNSTATTQVLTQAIITGNSRLLKSAGIARLASEGYQEYADSIGKTVRQLSSQERQQAVTNLIISEGAKVAGTYEGAMNAAGKVLRSFARIINDIQIEMGKVLLKAFGPMIKATYDLLKAFSKTMREGGEFSGTLDKLATSFQEITAPITDFIKNLTESVKSGEGIKKIANAIEEVIPFIMSLVETSRSLAQAYATVLLPAIQALTPALTAVANTLKVLLDAFNKLPGPVKSLIGVLVLFKIAMAKAGTDSKLFALTWTQVARSFSLGVTAIGVGLIDFQTKIQVAMMRGKGSVLGFSAAVATMRAGAVASFRAIKAAARGLMASLGPVGAFFAAATIAFEVMSRSSADTEMRVESLRDTIDETSGAMTSLSKQVMMTELGNLLSPEDAQILRDMGIGIEAQAEAIMQGTEAVEKFDKKIQGMIGRQGPIYDGLLSIVRDNFNDQVKIHDTAVAQFGQAELDRQAAALRTFNKEEDLRLKRQAGLLKEQRDRDFALRAMTSAEKAHADFSVKSSKAMEKATESATAAVKALDESTQNMLDAISGEASYDKAREGIHDLRDALKDGDKKLNGFSRAALENREAIRDAAKGYIDYANSLEDADERQEALAEGQRKIRRAIKDAGLDPKDSDILKTMKAEAEQSGKTVDEFAVQRDIAAQYGNEVGKNFIDGIIKQLRNGQSGVNTEAGMLVEGMPDAADKVLGSSSPSKEAMKVAKNFIDGIVVGVRQDKKLAEMEVSDLGDRMLKKLEDKLQQVRGVFAESARAFANMDDLTAGLEEKFGLPTQIEQAFGEGAGTNSILSGYRELSSNVQAMFAPMLDQEIVPKSVRRKNRKALNEALGQLDALTQTAIDLVKERESLQDRMSTLDVNYNAQVAEINQRYTDLEKTAADEMKAVEARFRALQGEIKSRYDALDRAAAANIKRIEDHYKQLIPTLQDSLKAANAAYKKENDVLKGLVDDRDKFLNNIGKSFRGFLNNLKVDTDKATRTVTRSTEKLVDGLKVITSETFTEETGGTSFADALQGRLDSLRAFSSNVRSLLSRGLDKTLVKDFVSAGIDSAGETVAALASGSDAQIAQINAAQSELGGLIESFQTASSADWFDYGVTQQEAIVAPLKTAADAAQVALTEAQLARDTELAAAKAQSEALKLNRQAELAVAQADRDAEVGRIKAYQEQLRLDRENELALAKIAYDKEAKEIADRLKGIEDDLAANAKNINATFLALRTKLLPKMKKFGENIIFGLIEGLKKRQHLVFRKARAIADRIRSEIALAFNFGSPSKVTMKMGEQIAQGLIVGMNNEMRNVGRTASALADQAMIPIATPTLGRTSPSPSVTSGMSGRGAGQAAGANVNITVNAGMGADGSNIGREIVTAIRQYERRNGTVFVSAR
jgi:hypothetical protein